MKVTFIEDANSDEKTTCVKVSWRWKNSISEEKVRKKK
jgi:hypothetical protein